MSLYFPRLRKVLNERRLRAINHVHRGDRDLTDLFFSEGDIFLPRDVRITCIGTRISHGCPIDRSIVTSCVHANGSNPDSANRHSHPRSTSRYRVYSASVLSTNRPAGFNTEASNYRSSCRGIHGACVRVCVFSRVCVLPVQRARARADFAAGIPARCN